MLTQMPDIQGFNDSSLPKPTDAGQDIWEQLDVVVASGDAEAARQFLKGLPPGEFPRIITQLSLAEQQ